MEKLDFSLKKLKEFALVMGSALLLITLVSYFRHHHISIPLVVIAAVFFVLGITFPLCLKPLYFTWMKLAFILNRIMTRIILTLLFYLVISPIGLCMRLLRIDPLDRKIEKEKSSYWKKKETKVFSTTDYEHQF